MIPTLTITDNADGTGATATIADSDPSSLNTVYTIGVRDLQLGIGLTNWSSAGQRGADGTITLPALGYYFAYCLSQIGTAPPNLSNLVYYVANRSGESVYQRIRAAVLAQIQSLSLPPLPPMPAGISSDRVYLQSAPQAKNIVYPCILISNEDEQEGVGTITNRSDDIAYPVRVFIADRGDWTFETAEPTYLLWRERIMSRFRFGRLAGVPEVWTCTPQPQLVIDAHVLQKYQHVVSGMTLRFTARQLRG